MAFSEQDSNLKPGLHMSRNDRKHMFANRFFKLSTYVRLGLYIVVMIAGTHTSQEIFAIDMLTALKPSLEHNHKHVV